MMEAEESMTSTLRKATLKIMTPPPSQEKEDNLIIDHKTDHHSDKKHVSPIGKKHLLRKG